MTEHDKALVEMGNELGAARAMLADWTPDAQNAVTRLRMIELALERVKRLRVEAGFPDRESSV